MSESQTDYMKSDEFIHLVILSVHLSNERKDNFALMWITESGT